MEKIVGAQGPSFEYVVMERCVDGVDCGAAHTCAPVDGAEGRRFRSIAYALLPSGTRSDAPPLVTTVCLYAGQSVSLATVEAAAHEEIRKRLTPPIVTSAPPGRSLVGLLTIYSTTPQPEPSINITQPVPGEIRATPAYTWDFGDGLTGVGPGLAYQAGDLPSKLPGKYLGATYRAAGVKHATLTVTWSVRGWRESSTCPLRRSSSRRPRTSRSTRLGRSSSGEQPRGRDVRRDRRDLTLNHLGPSAPARADGS